MPIALLINVHVVGTEMIPMLLKPVPSRQDVRLVVLESGRSQAQKLQRRQRMKLWHMTLQGIMAYIQPPQVWHVLQPLHASKECVVPQVQTSQTGVVPHCSRGGCVETVSVESENS